MNIRTHCAQHWKYYVIGIFFCTMCIVTVILSCVNTDHVNGALKTASQSNQYAMQVGENWEIYNVMGDVQQSSVHGALTGFSIISIVSAVLLMLALGIAQYVANKPATRTFLVFSIFCSLGLLSIGIMGFVSLGDAFSGQTLKDLGVLDNDNEPVDGVVFHSYAGNENAFPAGTYNATENAAHFQEHTYGNAIEHIVSGNPLGPVADLRFTQMQSICFMKYINWGLITLCSTLGLFGLGSLVVWFCQRKGKIAEGAAGEYTSIPRETAGGYERGEGSQGYTLPEAQRRQLEGLMSSNDIDAMLKGEEGQRAPTPGGTQDYTAKSALAGTQQPSSSSDSSSDPGNGPTRARPWDPTIHGGTQVTRRLIEATDSTSLENQPCDSIPYLLVAIPCVLLLLAVFLIWKRQGKKQVKQSRDLSTIVIRHMPQGTQYRTF